MGLFSTAKNVHEKGSIFKNIYKILLVVFVIGVLFISIKLSLDANDPQEGLKFLGGLFLYPTLELQQSIQQIMGSGVLWIKTNNFIQDIITNFILYDKILMSLFTIGFILFILFKITNWIIKNDFISFIISFILFIIIQMLTTAIGRQISPFTPFYVVVDFVKFCWWIFELIFEKLKGVIS